MAIKKLDIVTCSLDLGSIYSCSYNYVPQEGVTINLSFIREDGIYPLNFLSATNKAQIGIGKTYFNLYPISYGFRANAERKVLDVKFVDETSRLSDYYIALRGQGCGAGVYEIGQPVDKRTIEEKIKQAADPVAQQIKELTQFLDIEYSFFDLIGVIGQVFPVQVGAAIPVSSAGNYYDTTFTRSFVGTFREVLDNWCQYYGLGYFFENGTLKIFDPATLQITFPTPPADALDLEINESLENTFSKTAFSYFQQEGGERTIVTAGDTNSSLTTYVTLNALGNEFNLNQPTVDLLQVAAAQYGIEFWFLYNYFKGTAEQECGWAKKSIQELPQGSTIASSVNSVAVNGGIASIDMDTMNGRYEMYRDYGQKIAGRYYISNARSSIVSDQSYKWYNNSSETAFSRLVSFSPVQVNYIENGGTDGVIEGTAINKFYNGVKVTDNRIYYYDNASYDYSSNYSLSSDQQLAASQSFQALTEGFFGSSYMDYSEVGGTASKYILYQDQPGSVASLLNFGKLTNQLTPFLSRFTNFNIKGVKIEAILASQDTTAGGDNPNDTKVTVITTSGPVIFSDTSTVKVKNGSSYIVYYGKIDKCASANSSGGYHRIFLPNRISEDVPVILSVNKQAKNIYQLNRDLTYINQYVSSAILSTLAKPQLINDKSMSFRLNYLYDQVPISFLQNGLSSVDLEVGEAGISATYNYSNKVLQVPTPEFLIERLENQIKNSKVLRYEHNQTIIG